MEKFNTLEVVSVGNQVSNQPQNDTEYEVYIGLDVHKANVTVAVAEHGRQPARFRSEVSNTAKSIRTLTAKLENYDYLSGNTYTAGPTVTMTYDVDGNKIQETTTITQNQSRVTDYDVDGLGRIYSQSITYADSSVFGGTQHTAETQFQLDGEGNQIKVVDAEGGEQSFIYSPSGLLNEHIDAEGNITQKRYYLDGQLAMSVDPRGNSSHYTGLDFSTVNTYDGYGRLESTKLPIDPDTTIRPETTYSYYPNGSLYEEVVNDGDGAIVTYEYDERDHVVWSRTEGDSTAYETLYEYDEVGNQIRYIAPGSVITSTAYNRFRQPILIIRDMGDSRAFTYDEFGNLTQEIDSKGHAVNHGYDDLGRRVSTWENDTISGTQLTTTYGYDIAGNLTLAQDPEDREIACLYDERGLLIEESKFGFIENYKYNRLGNITQQIGADGISVVYVYDDNARPETITYSQSGGSSTTASYMYDEAGFTHSSIVGGVTTRYNYNDQGLYQANPYGRIEREQTLLDGKTFSVDYEYDANGNLSSLTGPGGTERMYLHNEIGELKQIAGFIDTDIQYNATGRLSHYEYSNFTSLDMTYDDNGRLTSRSYQFPVDDPLSWTYHYDNNDNILGWNDRIYTYDARNQMLSEKRTETFTTALTREVGYVANDVHTTLPIGTFDLDDEMIILDYNAGSIGLDLVTSVEISKIELSPESPIHRVDKENLEVLTSSDDVDYTAETEWFIRTDEDTGELTIVFSEPIIARYVKIHSTFDERNQDCPSSNNSDTWSQTASYRSA